MLVCGQVNPPPVATPGYGGVYFSIQDDLPGKATTLRGTPLRVEHNGGTHVGQVLQGWTDSRTGAMWALAEIDVASAHGAFTAAAVHHGRLGGFSLGYTSRVCRDPSTGRLQVGEKRIVELSIVKHGAHAGCTIAAHAAAARRAIAPTAEAAASSSSSSGYNDDWVASFS